MVNELESDRFCPPFLRPRLVAGQEGSVVVLSLHKDMDGVSIGLNAAAESCHPSKVLAMVGPIEMLEMAPTGGSDRVHSRVGRTEETDETE